MKTLTVLTYWSARYPQIRGISRKAVGRTFELLTVNTLQRYCFEVSLCGGSRDRGIDFRGIWKLNSRAVNILGQCKCYKRRLGPVHVRELEGAISHEHEASLALLVTNTGFTKDAYEHFMSSTYPLALTVLDTSVLHHCDEGVLGQTEALHSTTHFHKNNLSLNNLDNKNIKVDCTEIAQTDYTKQSLQVEQDDIYKELVSSPQDHNDDDLTQRSHDNHGRNMLPLHGGNITLLELNVTARQLLPEIVIGRSLKKSCHSMLLLHEDTPGKSLKKSCHSMLLLHEDTPGKSLKKSCHSMLLLHEDTPFKNVF